MFEAVSSHFNAFYPWLTTLSLINIIPVRVKAFVPTAAFPEEVHLNLLIFCYQRPIQLTNTYSHAVMQGMV